MVGYKMYAEIQERKQMGYSKRQCARELELDKKTVGKSWDMSEDAYAVYKQETKRRTRTLDPYREFIVGRLEEYPEITSAIIDDHPREAFGERFSSSYRSVRLYVAELREELGLPKPLAIRQYCAVEETPLGFQAQVDMGEMMMQDLFGKRVKIYIFSMVLSASRMKYVYFQDCPFTAQTFIEAHDLAFRYFNGRTVEIVYDQDRVMTVSENAGDILYTKAFEDYKQYVGFSVHLCRGNDPQSKGKIERVIGYVKNNFLACRKFAGISSLNSAGLRWLDRTANSKIHETTKMIPKRAFVEEQKCLVPAPTLSAPVVPKTATVRRDNVIHYRQNRYAVPRGTYEPGRKARIVPDEDSGVVHFYDTKTDELLATHAIWYGKGKLVGLPRHAERYRDAKCESLRARVLEGFVGIDGAEQYIAKVSEKYPRYVKDQLRIIRKMQETYGKAELEKALAYCEERDLVSANDFRDVLQYLEQSEPQVILREVRLPTKYQIVQAEIRPLESYARLAKGGDLA
jgi:transposase